MLRGESDFPTTRRSCKGKCIDLMMFDVHMMVLRACQDLTDQFVITSLVYN